MRNNTLQRGNVRYIVFKESDTWYGVGLELNITVEEDTPQTALLSLFGAIRAYLQAAKKLNWRVKHILNQKTDPEYEQLWDDLEAINANRKLDLRIFTHGKQNLATV